MFPFNSNTAQNIRKIRQCRLGGGRGFVAQEYKFLNLSMTPPQRLFSNLCHCRFYLHYLNSWVSEPIFIFQGDSRSQDFSASWGYPGTLKIYQSWFSWVVPPYTRVNSPNHSYPRVAVFQKLRSLAQSKAKPNQTLYHNCFSLKKGFI